MEYRQICQNEYQNLVVKLNSSNKTKNEKTKIYFFIKKENTVKKLYAAVSETQKVYLCEERGEWQPGYYSEFTNLEEFIADIMPDWKKSNMDLTDYILLRLFQLGD